MQVVRVLLTSEDPNERANAFQTCFKRGPLHTTQGKCFSQVPPDAWHRFLACQKKRTKGTFKSFAMAPSGFSCVIFRSLLGHIRSLFGFNKPWEGNTPSRQRLRPGMYH